MNVSSFLRREAGPWDSIAILMILLLSACGGTNSQATEQPSYTPLTMQNCGHTLTFTKAPSRIISTYQTTTDILLTLGLGDKIVGIYYGKLYQPEPQFDAAYKRLHNLGGDMMSSVPSKEVVLSLKPDFVFSAYPAGDFLSSYGLPTQEQFNTQGAQIYGMSGECRTDTTQAHVDDVYSDILNIGRIFNVESRAKQIVDSMKTRIASVQQHVKGQPQLPVVATAMMADPAATGTFTVIGAGIYTDLLRIAGGANIFGNQAKTYVSVSKEVLAARKPQAFVIIHYQGSSADKLSSYLYKTLPNVPASQQQRVFVVEANKWNAGIFLPDAVEQLARAFHPEAFR